MSKAVLLVDDMAVNRQILRGMLHEEYSILEAAGGEEALKTLIQDPESISAVLLDITMPDMDGYEVLRRIRSNPAIAQIPVIMVTGSEDEESRIKSLTLGANDYAMKPYNSEIIKHCLQNNIALHEASATMSAMQWDKLTGLFSREAFFERTQEKVSSHEPGHFIMACFDINQFKIINDQYGTQKGDAVLRYIADTFRKGFESHGGICCRFAADNFAVLYPASFQDTQEIEDIRKRASRVEGLASPIIFSIGRYLIDDTSLTPDAMYDRAVLAANTIKGRYDTKIAVYDETMREHLIREQEIVMDMEDALAERQFEVWFQPQYNHSTGAMIGAEALVRWRHPRRGLVPPNDFIPIFEQNGFIYSLDKFVWEEVCRYLRMWLDDGRDPLPVSVNVSRYDIFQADITEVIVGLLERYDLPVDLLRLEITESAFSETPQHIVDVVKDLVERGFTVEIDDFGSGYSSLNTLKDVPAQIIKLDMKFIESSSDSQRGGNIVESVVRMAKWLGVSVIAEGVETLKQADYLRSIGCNYLQGYLYAKPMPVEDYLVYCSGGEKEERLLALETVENLDNNSFWDPESMDTLIFNSYVGGACIFEYHQGVIELLRATEKYAQMISGAGMTVEDALKLDWTEHLDAEVCKRLFADLEESATTRKEITGEYVFLNLPNCPRETYLRSTMRVIATAGERYLVYCTNENITAQRQSERRERQIAEELQAVMENVDLGIIAVIVKNGSAHYQFMNDRYCEMLGYTREQFEEEVDSPYATIAPEDRQRVMEETGRINHTGESVVVVYDIITRSGVRRTIRSAIALGSLSRVDEPVQLSVLRDITEEVEAEERERKAAEQTQVMMDDMPGGFVRMAVAPDGSIVPAYINAGFTRLIGMSYDEVMQLYATDAFAGVHPDDIGIVNDVIAKMLEEGEAYSSRYRLRHGNGGYIWLSIFGRVTTDAAGEIFLNVYYMDATEQVEEEERQKELLDNLPGGAALYEYERETGGLVVIHLNKNYWELVGRAPASYTGMLPLGAVHPDDMTVVAHELPAAIEQKRDMVCDIRLRHETAGYRLVHLVGRIVPKEGDTYSVYATFTPIADDSLSYQQMLPLLLSAMMDSTSDLSFAKDTDLRYISASRAFANLTGRASESEVIGKTDYDLFDAEMATKFRYDDEALLKSGEPIIDMVEAIPSEDGTPRYSSTSKYLLRDGSGDVVGLYGVGRDVTKVVVQDSQLELVNDSIPGGLATYLCTRGDFSAEHIKITYFNDGFCKLFGYTRAEYREHALTDPTSMIFEEDRQIIAEQWLALMEQNAQINCMYRVRVKDGSYKWISHKGVAADRKSGMVVINAILQDVTDQRELIEQLRISEEENNLAVRLGGSVICRFSVADRTLTLSPEIAAAYALPETISGVPAEPIRLGMIAPESSDAYTGFFETIIRGSKAATATFQQSYLGGWRWLEAKSSTIFSDEGAPVKAVISLYDVTEELERESIYKRWQRSFEDRGLDSYTLFRCNLNNVAIYSAVEGTLLSFDFQNVGQDFNERAREYVRQCVFEDDADRYIALVNADTLLAGYYHGKRADMIEYREKLSDGNMRWLRLTIDLAEYPTTTEVEAYLMYEDIDEAKRSELQTKELSETDPLTGVLNRVTFAAGVDQTIRNSKPEDRHALLMLDVDGFKQVNDVFGHSAGDQVLIDIADGLRSMMRHGDLVARFGGDEFLVFLNGILDENAAAAKAKQICALARRSFSLEVQISASIGIAIAPHDGMDFETLYKKADSALYYVKDSGKDGYVFYNENMKDGDVSPERSKTSSSTERKREKKRRMLIIDDSSIDQTLFQNIFKDEFLIEKAPDGASGLIRLRHYGSAISIVLLDMVMPGMDGFAVLEKMRASAELQSIPVIIVSGDESRETCLEAIRQGATDYITKPVDAELLRIRTHSAISRAENERLRAKNCFLELQNEERIRYESALESTGITFIEYNWFTGEFSYYPSVSEYLSGTYDEREFWRILLSDMVTDTQTVQDMQSLVHAVAETRDRTNGSMLVKLKTPHGIMHDFRMNVHKVANEYRLTNKLIIALVDLECGVAAVSAGAPADASTSPGALVDVPASSDAPSDVPSDPFGFV